MAQGTQVSGNLFHDNLEDLFVEVDHGPFLVENNLLLSTISVRDVSEGGAYVHNLMAGRIVSQPELSRSTPYHPPHSTALAGLVSVKGGDNRFYNNIFIGAGESAAPSARTAAQAANGYGLWVYDARPAPLQTGGNVYYHGARPYAQEEKPIVEADVDPRVKLLDDGGNLYLHLTLGPAVQNASATPVTTGLLGNFKITDLPLENPDGSPWKCDSDYFGKKRNAANPTVGPFENPGSGPLSLKVW